MKILRVKILKNRTADNCNFTWPKKWDSEKANVCAYENNPNNIGNEVIEYCIAVIKDDSLADQLIGEGDAEILSKDQANIYGQQYRPRTVRIINDRAVCNAIEKLMISKPLIRDLLKQKELDALDKENSESGINLSPEFNIDNYLF